MEEEKEERQIFEKEKSKRKKYNRQVQQPAVLLLARDLNWVFHISIASDEIMKILLGVVRFS